MEEKKLLIYKKNKEAQAEAKTFICDPILTDLDKLKDHSWTLYHNLMITGDERRQLQNSIDEFRNMVPKITVDEKTLAEVIPPPKKKKSNDCYLLQICPHDGKADKMGLDCGLLCQNCQECPVTCGHWNDVGNCLSLDGEPEVNCGYFRPNRLFELEFLLDNIQVTLNFSYNSSGEWSGISPPETILKNIMKQIEETIHS